MEQNSWQDTLMVLVLFGVLEGIWGGYGSDKTGTEKATKKKS